MKKIKEIIVTKSFIKKNGLWYIDLPEYIEQGLGTQNNLLMVDGADTFLDVLSNNGSHIIVKFSNTPFIDYTHKLNKIKIGLNKNLLKAIGHAIVDYGAYYIVEQLNNHQLWLCPVAEYVFQGEYPNTIYLKIV